MRLSTAAATLGAMLTAQPLLAQSLAERVNAAPAGFVRMSYPAREGVCSQGSDRPRDQRVNVDWIRDCEDGPVRVQLEKDAARIVGVSSYVGGRWQPRENVTDLGDVGAQDASEFLLDLAASALPTVAEDALLPAVIANAPDPWRRLLALARDRALHANVRNQAIFWLGQSAAGDATAGLAALAAGNETTEVQKAAVFALSQRDDPDRIEQLIRVARTHSNPQVVRAAFFWLAQSEDPRAVDLFEKILSNADR